MAKILKRSVKRIKNRQILLPGLGAGFKFNLPFSKKSTSGEFRAWNVAYSKPKNIQTCGFMPASMAKARFCVNNLARMACFMTGHFDCPRLRDGPFWPLKLQPKAIMHIRAWTAHHPIGNRLRSEPEQTRLTSGFEIGCDDCFFSFSF